MAFNPLVIILPDERRQYREYAQFFSSGQGGYRYWS
jgi:hypothetical protein